MEIQVPNPSNQIGIFHFFASILIMIVTRTIIKPWPNEKRNPINLDNLLLVLTHLVIPSITAKWSGSKPCLIPNRNTSSVNVIIPSLFTIRCIPVNKILVRFPAYHFFNLKSISIINKFIINPLNVHLFNKQVFSDL